MYPFFPPKRRPQAGQSTSSAIESLEPRQLFSLPTGVAASAGAAYTFNASANSLSLTSGTLTFNLDVGSTSGPTLDVSADGTASSLVFNSTEHLDSLTLTDGATAAMTLSGTDTVNYGVLASYGTTLALANTKALVLNDLSIPLAGASLGGGALNTAQGTLDLANNAMVLNYMGPTQTAIDAANALVGSASDTGAWDGTGVTSSEAAEDAQYNGFTAVGVAENSTTLGLSAFAGQDLPADQQQMLFMFTYEGDATLDGKVGSPDIQQYLSGLPSNPGGPAGTGWAYGEFDYTSSPGTSTDLQLYLAGVDGYDLNGSINSPTLLTPSGFAATPASTTSITLTWPTDTGASWLLQRSADTGATWTTLGSGLSSSPFTDTGLSGGSQYYYALFVSDSAGNVSPAAVVGAATQAAAPTAVTATINSGGSATVAWTPGTGDSTQFWVYRTNVTTGDGGYTQIGGSNDGSNTYTDPAAGLTPGDTFSYMVLAQDANNPGQFSPYSNVASATIPLPAPTGLAVAGVTDTTATLTWTAPPGAASASYSIWRDGEEIGSTAATAFQDTGLSPGSSYTYTVAANSGGVPSDASAAVTATTNATANDSTPPSAPTGLALASATDHSVTLAWSASTDNVGVVDYEVDQEASSGDAGSAFMAGQTPTTTITIGGLSPSTTYTFIVKACDAMNNDSASDAFQASTASDHTAPTAPANFLVTANTGSAISLSWTASSDNVGVTGYTVQRAASPNLGVWTTIGTPLSTSFTDSNVTAGVTYEYAVLAQDAAGNSSGSSLTVVAATPASTDTAPSQYIPPDWQNYFYTQLTPALRQRDVMAGLTAPPAQGWLDNSSDAVIVGGVVQSSGLPTASNVAFLDGNGNGQYDPGEAAWTIAPGTWSAGYTSGDTLLAGTAPPVGTQGRFGVYYQDLNQNGQIDPGETLPVNINLIQGVQGQLAYRDLGGTGKWQVGDPIWYDANNDSQYDSGDPIVYAGSVTLHAGDLGKKQGLCYYNSAGDTTWNSSDTLVWVDNTTFSQDFAAMYAGLDAVIPKFGRTDSGGVYPNDTQSLGSILQSLDDPQETPGGTVSVAASAPDGVGTVTGSGTDFADDLAAGDFVLLNGNWYPVSSSSGSTLHLAHPYFGPAFSGTFTVINWTLIPAESTVAGEPGLSFSYQRGQPTANSVVFPQQFQELQGVINALTQLPNRYDVALFTSDSSAAFISAAVPAINAYRSIFGTPSDPTQDLAGQLENILSAGLADPGSVERAAYVSLLENVTDAVAQFVSVRDPGSPTSGYWKMSSSLSTALPDDSADDLNVTAFSPKLTASEPYWWQLSSPLTFNRPEERAVLLPQLSNASGAVTRIAGNWSTVSAGGPIGPVDVSEVSGFLSAVDANGLWIAKGQSTGVTPSYQGEVDKSQTYDANNPPPDWPAVSSYAGWGAGTEPLGGIGVQTPFFMSSYQYVTGDVAYYDYTYNPGYSVTELADYAGATVAVTLPNASNPNGGSDVTTLALGPDGGGVDPTGWSFGDPNPVTLASITAAQAKIALDAALISPSSLTALAPTSLANGNSTGSQWWWWAYSGQSFDQNGNVNSGSQQVQVFLATANPSLYGLVPLSSSFTYSTDVSAPQLPAPIAPPSSPLPPTTALDYLNAVPDTDADDIVNVSQDLTSPGNDTGSIAFEADRDLPQAYIPIYTDASGALPIHAYIVQGGFGSSATGIGTLGSTAWTSPDISETGVPYSYSLDTRVRVNMLVNIGPDHIKRIEVIRPRGNAVVFDFAWDAAANQFSPIGTPDGYSGRDASRLYVLRDLTPQDDGDLSYAMQFPSGITQVFGGSAGYIQSVHDSNGLTTHVTAGLYNQSGSVDVGPFPTTPIATSNTYNVTLNWAGGHLDNVTYVTKDNAETFTTSLIYNAQNTGDLPAIVSVNKSADGAIGDGDSVPDFSYQLLDPTTIGNDGTEIARTGTVASGTVTITTSLAGVTGGSSSETWGFNSDRLVTSDTSSLTEPDGTQSSAVTSYQYNSGARTTANDSAIWGQVSQITFPDDSWESFTYTADTGWLATETTPFKNTGTTVQTLGYTDASGTGDVADTTQLVERPRQVTTAVNGIVTGIVYNQYHNPTFTSPASTFVTRHALANAPTPTPSAAAWAAAGLQSTTSISGFDSYIVTSPTGTVDVSNGPTNSSTVTSFFGHTTSVSNASLNAFGVITTTSNQSLGAANTGTNPSGPGPTDALGRPLTITAIGGATESISNYSWQGPQTIVAPDQTTTTYTYFPWGAVHTETTGTLTVSFAYDDAGNIVTTTNTGTAASGTLVSGPALTTSTSEDWDALAELTKYTDEMGRSTTYAYVPSPTGTTVTTTNPDGTTEIDAYYLDGTPQSVSGTAVTANPTPTPSPTPTPTPTPTAMSYDEGVDSNGDLWSDAVQGGSLSGANWTTTYTNILGEQYQTQTSADNGDSGSAVATETVKFDNNGRPITDTGFDGSVTHIDYNPQNGTVADTWLDAGGSGSLNYMPGVDPRTVYSATDPSYYGGTTMTTVISSTGSTTDAVTVSNGGLNSSETVGALDSTGVVHGLTTATAVTFPTTGGETDTTTNPDGTRLTDTYTQGLLASAVTLPPAGTTPITSDSFGYDSLQRNDATTDWTGATTLTLRADGSISGETLPDGRTSTVTATQPSTDAPTATQRTDGTTVNAGYNTLGEQTSQSGAGQLPANFGYDQTTGQLTGISTFSSGTLNGAGQATTSFGYSPNTGAETSKTYADGSSLGMAYNSKLQLTNIQSVDPAGHYTSSGVLGYNAAGEQTSAAFTDYLSGGSNVSDAVKSIDDMGRAGISTETAQNPADPTGASTLTTTSTQTFTPTQQLQSDASGPSGATTVYAYYPTSGTGSTGGDASPGALESVKLVSAGATLSETDYGYDQTSGRMDKVTIVGQNGAANQIFNIAFQSGTNLISLVAAPGSGTYFGYDPKNGRLTSLATKVPDGPYVYSATLGYYNNDQRNTDTVTRTNADGSTDSYQNTYGYDAADELNSVETTGTGGTFGSWTFDGVGNRTGFAGGTNSLNQYTNDTYNARGDCTFDGTWHLGYDALDRLISAENSGLTQKVTFGYDAESRLSETDIWTGDGAGGWTLASTVRNAWDGSNLIAQFDGGNKLLRSFAYGPTGLLGITDYTSGSPVTYVPVMDAAGSIVQLLDTSGNVVADFHYDAWGNRTAAGPAAGACPFGFAGMLQDPTTGLYFDNARWYSATQGRFLTRDPSGESGGLNLYAYCGNDPVNESDPTGLRGNYNGAAVSRALHPPTNTFWSEYWSDKVPSPSAPPHGIIGLPGAATGTASLQAAKANSRLVIIQADGTAVALADFRDGAAGFADGFVPGYSWLRHQLGPDFQVNEDGAIYAGGVFVGTAVQLVATAGVNGVAPCKVVNWAKSVTSVANIGERGTQALAVGGRVLKVGSRVVGGVMTVSGVVGTVQGAAGAYDTFQNGQDLKGTFQAGTAALNAFQIGHGAYRAWQGWGGTNCFIAGTQVVTLRRPIEPAEGGVDSLWHGRVAMRMGRLAAAAYATQAIETLRPGSLVLTRDQSKPDAPLTLGSVEELFVRTAYRLTVVAIRSSSGEEQTLYTTSEHPVYVTGRGWVECGGLEVGDELTEPGGGVSVVTAAATQDHPIGITVYNLRVAESHTYFVRQDGSTAEPVWAHNADYPVTVSKVNGRYPINGGSAGETILVNGRPLQIKINGSPDYGPYIKLDEYGNPIRHYIEYTGSRAADFDAANAAANLAETPDGYIWHHQEDVVLSDGQVYGWLELVEDTVHVGWRHTGGVAKYTELTGLKYKP